MIANNYAPNGEKGAQVKGVSPFAENYIQFHRRGFHIFPLAMGQKYPITSRGHKDATNDITKLEDWAEKFPNANIGIATEQSGLVVVDCDSAKGKTPPSQWAIDGVIDGLDVLAVVAERNGATFPYDTLTVWSPRKGCHFYFRDQGQPIRSGSQVNGLWLVDVKSRGGYIVAPSSIFEGRQYVQGEIDTIEPLPNWLRAELSQKPQAPIGRTNSKLHYPTHQSSRYPKTKIDEALSDLSRATEGTRNDTLASVAFKCGFWVAREKSLNSYAIDRLRIEATAIGLEQREIEATIKSAFKSGLIKGFSNVR